MTNTHTTAHIPDEAVQAAYKACEENTHLPVEERLRLGVAAALPHLSAPCSVEVKDIRLVLEPFASRADRYDVDDAIIINDCVEIWQIARNKGMEVDLTVGQLRAARELYDRLSNVITKPVDVAAVRRQAFEEVVSIVDRYPLLSQVSAHIRALSAAEPAQGEQWQDIETAPKNKIIIGFGRMVGVNLCYHNGKQWNKTELSASFQLSRQAITHWMPLPAAPTTEAGK